MIQSYDVGSMPLEGNQAKIVSGAALYGSFLDLLYKRDSVSYFEEKMVEGFRDNIEI